MPKIPPITFVTAAKPLEPFKFILPTPVVVQKDLPSYLSSIEQALSKKDLNLAYKLIEEAEVIYKDDLSLKMCRGKLFFLTGNLYKAEEIFWSITKDHPQDILAWSYFLTVFENDSISFSDDKSKDALLLTEKLAQSFHQHPIKAILLSLKGRLYFENDHRARLNSIAQLLLNASLIEKTLFLSSKFSQTTDAWGCVWVSFVTAVKASPTEVPVIFLLEAFASALFRAEQPDRNTRMIDDVIMLLDQLLEVYSDHFDMLLLKGLLLARQNRFEEFTSLVGQLNKKFINHPEKFDLFLGMPQLYDAILLMMLQPSFGNGLVFKELAKFLEFVQLPQLSQVTYRKLVQFYPDDKVYQASHLNYSIPHGTCPEQIKRLFDACFHNVTNPRIYAKISLILAQTLFNHNYFGDAYEPAKKAIESSEQMTLVAYLNQCMGKFDVAIDLYNKVQKLKPHYGKIWEFLANCYQGKKADTATIIMCWEQAIKCELTNPEYHFRLGEAYRNRLHKLDLEIKKLNEEVAAVSLENDPENSPWPARYTQLVTEYDVAYEKSYQSHENALSFNPKHTEALHAQIILLQVKERYAAALTKIKQFIKLKPNNPYIYKLRGEIVSNIEEDSRNPRTFLNDKFKLVRRDELAEQSFERYLELIRDKKHNTPEGILELEREKDSGDFNVNFAQVKMKLDKFECARKLLSEWTIPPTATRYLHLQSMRLRMLIQLTEDLNEKKDHHRYLTLFKSVFGMETVGDFPLIYAKSALRMHEVDEAYQILVNWQVTNLDLASSPLPEDKFRYQASLDNELKRLEVLTEIYALKNDTKNRLITLNKYLELEPHNHAIRLERAFIYFNQTKYDAAFSDFENVYASRKCTQEELDRIVSKLSQATFRSKPHAQRQHELIILIAQERMRLKEFYPFLQKFQMMITARVENFAYLLAQAALSHKDHLTALQALGSWNPASSSEQLKKLELLIPLQREMHQEQELFVSLNLFLGLKPHDKKAQKEILSLQKSLRDKALVKCKQDIASAKNDKKKQLEALNNYLLLKPSSRSKLILRGLILLENEQHELALNDFEKVASSSKCLPEEIDKMIMAVENKLPSSEPHLQRALKFIITQAISRQKTSRHLNSFHLFGAKYDTSDIKNYALHYARATYITTPQQALSILFYWKPSEKADKILRLELIIKIYRQESYSGLQLEALNEYLDLDPTNTYFRLERARILLSFHEVEKALADFDKAPLTKNKDKRMKLWAKNLFAYKNQPFLTLSDLHKNYLVALKNLPRQDFEIESEKLKRHFFALIWTMVESDTSHPLHQSMVNDPLYAVKHEVTEFCLRAGRPAHQPLAGIKAELLKNDVSSGQSLTSRIPQQLASLLPSCVTVPEDIMDEMSQEVELFKKYLYESNISCALVSLYLILHYQRKFDFVGEENPLQEIQAKLKSINNLHLVDAEFVLELIEK